MTNDWRSIEGNEHVFSRLCELVKSGEAIAFVGAGASAGLYPLWTELIYQLADQAVSRGSATKADRDFWIKNIEKNPDGVVTGIKHSIEPGVFGELLREIFKKKTGPDGNPFTPLHGDLIKLPFKGYITTNFDPGLTEARTSLLPDGDSTGWSTWQDKDIERWYNGEIFREQPCPVLFAHGYYRKVDSLLLASEDYKQAYSTGPFRSVLGSIWQQRNIVFVGFGFSDRWIGAIAKDRLFDPQPSAPRHIAMLGIPMQDEYTPQMRRTAREQYSAEALFYPIAYAAEREDHGALRSILDELRRKAGKKTHKASRARTIKKKRIVPPTLVAGGDIKYRWVHETTEDRLFTGRADDLKTLDRWAVDPAVRVITVTGIGGLGKTSLVSHWAKNNAAGLGRSVPIKGILFWSIYTDRDVKRLFEAITKFAVDELKVQPPQGPLDVAATALEMLRSTSMLLVIDGLELVQELSPSVPSGALLRDELRELAFGACRSRHDSLVVLTSRFPFADLMDYLGDELRDLALAHLSAPEGAALLAVCGARGTQAEREAASREFEGHPLGLRLLALALKERKAGDPNLLIQEVFAKAGSLKDDTSEKLKHLLDFYEKTMPPIRVALMGVVSFFRSLAPLESVLDLTSGVPAVAAVTHGRSASQLEDELKKLSDQYLLIADPGGNAWSCHPILRDHFRQSVLGWLPKTAAAAASVLTKTKGHRLTSPQNIRALEPVLAAIELLLDANDFYGAEQLFRKQLKDGRIFRQLAAPSEGMRCALGFIRDKERRRRCESELSRDSLAAFANTIGVCARETGEFEFGAKHLEECTRIYRERNQKVKLSTGLQNWTGLLIILGRLSEAEERAREAVAAAREVDATQELRGSLSYLGTVLGKRGKVGAALVAFAEATKLEHLVSQNVEGLFSRRGIRFADLLLRIGRMDEAQRLTTASLEICKKKEWQEETARCLSVLGEIALSKSYFEEADALLETAEKIFRDGNTLSQLPRILIVRGGLELRREKYERAKEAIDEARTLAASRKMRLDNADALLMRARLLLQQAKNGNPDAAPSEIAVTRASDDAEAARQFAQVHDYAWGERDALALLAECHERLGLPDRALRFRREAAALSKRLADTGEPATTK